MGDSLDLSTADLAALAFFLIAWVLHTLASDGVLVSRMSLTTAMNAQRQAWMHRMAEREIRIVDTAIMGGLQQGTAFFASSSLIALGGCFALLGASDRVLEVLSTLPLGGAPSRPAFQIKVLGLVLILAFSFFKFGWAYRLFNYCSILIGAVPIPHGEASRNPVTETAVWRAAQMNMLAGKHFNSGLRGVFFSIGYLGWFVDPVVFVLSTLLLLAVLVRRQFFSAARRAVIGQPPGAEKGRSMRPDSQ
ncbi:MULTISPECIES: DUF599 domain-containing protein [unclassified Mesorhizobium]|uniref:DUF599 domain-containing protein n=1 Tax=unclassified Mesorhizobium TaxID=325217 RepID=UPI001129A7A0|nr:MULTISPECIES: DUF599 domain-containing protein [unclassified Mesorhizobium]TPJ46415.1 DUF599 domain-containing protein [Mesorhizobium sp. B2-6-6]MBZ9960341.1 DUF599 domain-containing protein [Mesorhizobium sp. BR1-1-14]MCA0003453.1 DUF599 domain-containing protein [Mesorhizobium sp. B264B2A]MCA0009798.1 DUF599 domain-containing protein [Mesorhizobium sp. B264B1B]MCA0022745.1 DUF599 domain-containing protein [Mesorhizobium sp. B264B1A]